MRVLWVSAHPDERSLTASLRREGLRALRADGHEYRESNLYAMGWDPVVGPGDFGHDPAERLLVAHASKRAYRSGGLRADIRAEQRKLCWSDTLVLQFPLWWHSMPAILKGWFDRVFVKGFAYGVKEPGTRRTLRYGEGGLAGRRALVIATVGAPAPSIGPRGIHGDLEEMLFPLLHGTLWYSGIAPLPPLVVPDADRLTPDGYRRTAVDLRARLAAAPTAAPIPFRTESGGDYDTDLVLCPDRSPDRAGLGVHRRLAAGGYARSR